jgi:hypothetical protein
MKNQYKEDKTGKVASQNKTGGMQDEEEGGKQYVTSICKE